MITWTEPRENNGNWWLRVEGLNPTQINALYKHPVCSGAFVHPHPGTGKAHPAMSNTAIMQHGVVRCYWWLREDILERDESTEPIADEWEEAIADALEQEVIERDTDDKPSAIGHIGWRDFDDNAISADGSSYLGRLTWGEDDPFDDDLLGGAA